MMAPHMTTSRKRSPISAFCHATLVCAAFAALGNTSGAQTPASSGAQTANPPSVLRDYSRGRGWFPLSIKPFRPQPVPPPVLENSTGLKGLANNGTIALSVSQLDHAVVENNLSVDSARYTVSLAATDLLKSRAGQAPSGTDAAPIPSALGSVSFGSAGSGSANTRARAISVGPRGSFDPALTFNLSIDQTSSVSNSTRVNGVASITTHTNNLGAAYVQAFTTGTSFSLNWNVQRQTTTSKRSRFNPSLSSNYNLSVNQQLLSGFGFRMNRRFQKVAETNRETARQYFALQVITQLVSAENAYWDLVAAKEQVRTAQQALDVSNQLLSDNRKQAEIGTMAPLDVVSAESEVAGRKRDLIVAQTAVQVAELKLKNMMVRRLDDALAAIPVQTTDALPEPQDSDIPSFDDALAAAMRNRPEINQAEGNIRNQDVAVQYTKAKLKPSLSIFGLFSSAGRESDFVNAFSQAENWNFPEYAYGFSFSFPLRNRSAQADHQTALLTRQQSEVSLQRTRDQIRLEVRNALIGLVQAKAQIASARMAVDLNQQTVDAEQKKLRAGTSTSYNVILKQRDLFSAQLAEVQARVTYAKALVEMDRSAGNTLEKRRLDLDQIIAGSLASNSAAAPAMP
jgi:outer membrane protein